MKKLFRFLYEKDILNALACISGTYFCFFIADNKHIGIIGCAVIIALPRIAKKLIEKKLKA